MTPLEILKQFLNFLDLQVKCNKWLISLMIFSLKIKLKIYFAGIVLNPIRLLQNFAHTPTVQQPWHEKIFCDLTFSNGIIAK